MKKTTLQLLTIRAALQAAGNLADKDNASKKRIDFVFNCVSNMRTIDKAIADDKEKIEAVAKTVQESEKLKAYSKAVQAVNEKYADKDASGKPKLSTQGKQQVYTFAEEIREKRKTELVAIDKKHADAVKEQADLQELEKEYLEKKYEIDFKTIGKEYLPSEITAETLDLIFDIIA